MRIGRLTWVILGACLLFVLVNAYVIEGTSDGNDNVTKILQGPSPEMREYLLYIITAVLVGFIGYLAMTRR